MQTEQEKFRNIGEKDHKITIRIRKTIRGFPLYRICQTCDVGYERTEEKIRQEVIVALRWYFMRCQILKPFSSDKAIDQRVSQAALILVSTGGSDPE